MNTQKFLPQSKTSIIKANQIVADSSGAYSDTPLLRVVESTEKKVNAIFVAMQETYTAREVERKKKKKEDETQRRVSREKERENSDDLKQKDKSDDYKDKSNISISDRLLRFGMFTLAGFFAKDFGNILTGISNVLDKLKPVSEFLQKTFTVVLNGTIALVEAGYTAYDKLESLVKIIGGEDAAKEFNTFSDILNKWLNYTLLLGYTFRIPKPKPKPPGGGAGAGFAAGFASGLAMCALTSPFGSPAMAKEADMLASARSTAKRSVSKTATGARVTVSETIQEIGGTTSVSRQSPTATLEKTSGIGGTGGSGASSGGKTKRYSSSQTRYTPSKKFDAQIFLGSKENRQAFDEFYSKVDRAKDSPSGLKRAMQDFEMDFAMDAAARDKALLADDDAIFKALQQRPPRRRDRILNRLGLGRGSKIRESLQGSTPEVKGPGGKFSFRQRPQGMIRGAAIGAVIDLVIKLISGEDPGRAFATSAGAALGGAVGGFLGGLATAAFGIGTGGIGAFLAPVIVGGAAIAGATLFEYVVGKLYDGITSSFSGKPKALAEGGITRNIRRQTKRTQQLNLTRQVRVDTTVPGKDMGGRKNIESALGENQTRILENVSTRFKRQDLLGSIGGISIDFILGQKISEKSIDELALGLVSMFEPLLHSQFGGSNEYIEKIKNKKKSEYKTMLRDTFTKNFSYLKLSYSGVSGSTVKDQDLTEDQQGRNLFGFEGRRPTTKNVYRSVLPQGNPQFSSGFGWRWGKNHNGIDIGVDAGSPVTAIADGVVSHIVSGFGGNGVAVYVKHSDGTTSVYGHVDAKVKENDIIKKGQVIATVKGWYNAYGNKDNTHLHFERITSGGTYIDPAPYLDAINIERKKKEEAEKLKPQKPEEKDKKVSFSPTSVDRYKGINQEVAYNVLRDQVIMYQEIIYS